MMDWKPVTRGKARALGVHPENRQALAVEVDLDRLPPAGWDAFFERPEGVGISMSMHPPRLSGRTIHIMAPDTELENYLANVDARIGAANATYEKRVLPQVRAAEAAAADAKKEEQRRLAEAQRKLEKL